MKFDPEMLTCYFVAGTQDFNNSLDKFLMVLKKALEAGITAFQFREKDGSKLSFSRKVELGTNVRNLCNEYQVPLFVDDDLELAKMIKADGIHVGQKDQKIETILNEAGSMMVGYSCDTLEQIEHANDLDVDYVGSGPVFATQSKADADPCIGVDGLTELVKNSKHPVVAIGGLNKDNLKQVATSNCAGAAMISYLSQSEDLKSDIAYVKSVFGE